MKEKLKRFWCKWFHEEFGVTFRRTQNVLYLKCKKCGVEHREVYDAK